MLARTADSIFWVSRYVERADFSGAHHPGDAAPVPACRWPTIPTAAAPSTPPNGTARSRRRAPPKGSHKTGAVINETNVIEYLVFSTDNPSSIRNCIAYARSNARSIRVALTTEMWESINGAWFELVRFEQLKMDGKGRRLERDEN